MTCRYRYQPTCPRQVERGARGGYRQRRSDRGAHSRRPRDGTGRGDHARKRHPLRHPLRRCDLRAARPQGANSTGKSPRARRSQANQTLFEIQGPARCAADRRAHGAQFPAAAVRHRHGGACLCRAAEGHAAAACSTPARPSPGCASAQKYAVRVGGGQNHRMGLFDGILIKENHIMAAGSIARAVAAARVDRGPRSRGGRGGEPR